MVLCLIGPPCRGDVLLPPSENILQRFIQVGVCLVLDPVGDAIGCLGDTAGNGRQGVAVTSKRDGIAYGILKSVLSRNAMIAWGTVSWQVS